MVAAKIVLVAACALIDADGRVLIAQRPEGKSMAGLWEFPGGKVEISERPEETLIRELREEFRVPILLVTHDLDAAFAVGDNMLVYEGGRIAQRGRPLMVMRQPVSENVARLFGYSCFLPAEVVKLNPAAGSGVLRFLEREFACPYIPGSLIGDRLTVCLRPDELTLADGPGPNRMTATLAGVEEQPAGVRLRLHTDGGMTIVVEVGRPQWEAAKERKEQYIEFPAGSLCALRTPPALKE